MMKTRFSPACVARSLFAAITLLAGAANAQSDFPARAVNLVVPFPPGGAVDQAGRSISQSLSKLWKQPVLIQSRPGAGGAIGMAVVANAPADGYTLLATHPAILAVPEADRMFGRTPTSDRSSFTPLALLVAKSGVLRALVNTGAKRHPLLPEVPTAMELGYKDVEFYLWVGLFAPVKTPDAIVQILRRDVRRAVQEPDFVQPMAKLGAPIDYRDGPAFVDFLNKDAERISAAIKRIGKVD